MTAPSLTMCQYYLLDSGPPLWIGTSASRLPPSQPLRVGHLRWGPLRPACASPRLVCRPVEHVEIRRWCDHLTDRFLGLRLWFRRGGGCGVCTCSLDSLPRSEERRVGKEGRSRGAPY